MAKKLEWKTERRKVKDLIRYEKNPRILSPLQLVLESSIEPAMTNAAITAMTQNHHCL